MPPVRLRTSAEPGSPAHIQAAFAAMLEYLDDDLRSYCWRVYYAKGYGEGTKRLYQNIPPTYFYELSPRHAFTWLLDHKDSELEALGKGLSKSHTGLGLPDEAAGWVDPVEWRLCRV